MKNSKNKQSGFTLVELVITIAIVIILSVISVPIYRGYVDKAKWAEAYALAGTIFSAQKAYFSEHGHFYGVDSISRYITSNDILLGIDARGNKYFTLFNPNDNVGIANSLFTAYIEIPENLRRLTGYSYLFFSYNVTTGGLIYRENYL